MKLRVVAAAGLSFLCAHLALAADQTSTTQPTAGAAQVQTNKTTTQTAGQAATSANFTTDQQKISYSIGVDLGMHFKQSGIDVDPSILTQGFKDALTGSQMKMTQDEMNATLLAFQKQLIAKNTAAFNAASVKNKQASEAFLTANKGKPGVITTATGLQYKVVTKGTGTHPTDSDVVTVDYMGTTIDGKVFDSSYQRGKPATFPLTMVIPGWTEALKLMQPNATYEVYVPSALAYGERGFGNAIGPNQALIFKIHLISIKKATA